MGSEKCSRAGLANFFLKGHIVNILGLPAIKSLFS